MTKISQTRMLIDGSTLTEADVEKAIDDVIVELNKTNDTKGMDNALETLIGMSKFSVFYQCRLLHGYQKWWDETEQSKIQNDNFFDNVKSKHDLPNRLTIERYINLWSHYDKKSLPIEIKSRPLSEQIAIVAVVEDDRYEIKEDDWEDLVDASNGTEVRRILRRVKGKEPTKGSYVLHLGREGELYVWHQGQRVYWGQVKLPNGTTDPIEKRVIEKMCSRLKNGSMSPIVD